MTPPRPPEGKCELNRCNGNCSSGLRCLVCRNKQAHCSCYKFQPEGMPEVERVQLLNKCDCFPTTLGHSERCFIVQAVNAFEESRRLVNLHAKLVAALEAEHSKASGHRRGWAEQCEVCALLREAAK